MPRHTHFGRRIRLPSKIQIKHDLVIMAAADALAQSLTNQNCNSEDLLEIMKEIKRDYNISSKNERMIMDRIEHNS